MTVNLKRFRWHIYIRRESHKGYATRTSLAQVVQHTCFTRVCLQEDRVCCQLRSWQRRTPFLFRLGRIKAQRHSGWNYEQIAAADHPPSTSSSTHIFKTQICRQTIGTKNNRADSRWLLNVCIHEHFPRLRWPPLTPWGGNGCTVRTDKSFTFLHSRTTRSDERKSPYSSQEWRPLSALTVFSVTATR